jgi:hypothetical protein
MRGDFDAWAELLASYHGDVGGFAAGPPLSRHRCNHLTAELALTSKRSAASRRDAPISTALIARSRSSLGIPNPAKENQCTKTRSFGQRYSRGTKNLTGC